MSESSTTATSVSSLDASPTTFRLKNDTFSTTLRPSSTASLLNSDDIRPFRAGGPFDDEHDLWDDDDFDDDLLRDSRVKTIASVIMGVLLFVLLLGVIYWYIKRLTKQRLQAACRSKNTIKDDMIPLQLVGSHGSGSTIIGGAMQTTGITNAPNQEPQKIPGGEPCLPPSYDSILPPPPVRQANQGANRRQDARPSSGPQTSGVVSSTTEGVSSTAGNRDSIESQAILPHDTRRRSSIVSPIDSPRNDEDLDLERGLKPVGTKEFI